MKTKILHVPNYYPPHIGGIEDVCRNIIEITPDYYHRVVCFNHLNKTQKDYYNGVEVTRCSVPKKLFSQSLSASLLTEMRRLFKEFSPQIVHLHTPNPLASVYLSLFVSPKTQFIVHWHSDIVEQSALYKFYHPMERKMLERADKIVVTSPSYVNGSNALAPWENKLCVIPNTISELKLQKQAGDEDAIASIKQQYNGKKIVFTFGRHVPYKGLVNLVNAAPLIMHDAVVVIAGQGPESKKLKELPGSSHVRFTGRLSDDVLRQYLYASDVFAFPSITKNEAFGIALAEAMYCGLPAVTFTIPGSGVNWVSVNGETGLESPEISPESLAQMINQLLKDDELRHKLGENASKRARDLFIPNTIKNDLIALYEKQ